MRNGQNRSENAGKFVILIGMRVPTHHSFQAHTCRGHGFYYELALVSCVCWTHFCAEQHKQQSQHDTISNNYSSALAPKSLLILAAAAKYVSQSFTSKALQLSSPKVQQAAPDPCRIPSLNHHLATAKAGAAPRSVRHSEITQEEKNLCSRIVTLEGIGRKKLEAD